jgi:hypothetical protein
VQIEVSNSEIVDKFTILKIKELKITDPEKLKNIKKEIELLQPAIDKIGISEDSEQYLRLIMINSDLWKVEDEIREHEKLKRFDDNFISLARSAYTLNDKRSIIKKEINILTGSSLIEEKNHDLS